MAAPREFLLGEGTGIAAVTRALTAAWKQTPGADVREQPEREIDSVVLDSFDGLLHGKGLACRWEEGRLVLEERYTGEERARVPAARPQAPLPASALPSGRLTEVLAPILDERALLPLAAVRCRTRWLDLLDAERKTIARVRLEQPSLLGADGARRAALPGRVRVLPLRGYDEAAEVACRLLSSQPPVMPAARSLADEAVAASGHPPGGISSKIKVQLQRGERADAAAASVLLALLDVIEANLEGAMADLDPEFLHDFRVSVRRSRAVQREFKRVFPPVALAQFRAEFKWLQQATGDSRDLDVYVNGFEAMRAMVPEHMRASLDPLLVVLRRHRTDAHLEMGRALRSQRARGLLVAWRDFLSDLAATPLGDRPHAARPVEDVAGERIVKVYRHMVKMGRAIDRETPPEDYHELRKKGKELRYLLELFGASLYPEDVVGPLVKSLKALQDVLGRHQDREVQAMMLAGLRDEVGTEPGGAGALVATGALILRLGEDEREARAEFAERFAAFSTKSERRQVKAVFG